MKILPSSPEFETYNELQTLLALAKNPHMYIGEVDLEPFEINEIVLLLEDIMQSILDGLPIEFVEGMKNIYSEK